MTIQLHPEAMIELALAALDQCSTAEAVALLRAALAASQIHGDALLEQEIRYYMGALGIHRFSVALQTAVVAAPH